MDSGDKSVNAGIDTSPAQSPRAVLGQEPNKQVTTLWKGADFLFHKKHTKMQVSDVLSIFAFEMFKLERTKLQTHIKSYLTAQSLLIVR